MNLTRREALSAVVATSSAVLLTGGAAQADEAKKAAPGPRAMVPLPFDAKKLRGISEKLITSHWENNYGAAIKNLDKVEEELGA